MEKKTSIILNTLLLTSLSVYLMGIMKLHPTGYHVDIYSQLGLPVILGFVLVSASAMILWTSTGGVRKWIYFTIVLSVYIGIIISPHLLGYYLSDRGDSLQSVGYIRTILQSGHTDPLDIYPSQWIFLGTAKLISNIGLDNVLWASIILNNIIFILALSLFVRKTNSSLLLYFTTAFLLTWYHDTVIAEFYAYALNMLVMYILLSPRDSCNKMDIRGSTTILVLLLANLVFSHPFVAFFDLGILIILSIPELSKVNNNLREHYKRLLETYVIILVLWISWQSLLTRYLVLVPEFIRRLFIMEQISYASSMAGVGISDLVKYSIIRFLAQITLYTITIILASMYTFHKIPNTHKITRKNSSINQTYLLLIALWSMAFTVILIFQKHGYDRILGLNFMIFGAIIFISALSWEISVSTFRNYRYLSLGLAIILPFSIFSAFYSPINGMPYTGITNGELTGITFAFLHLSSQQKIIDPIGDTGRWSVWLYGYSGTFKKQKVLYLYRLPDHFGYENISCFSNNRYVERIHHNVFGYQRETSYNYSRLVVIIPSYPIEMYEKVPLFEKVKRFTYKDEKHLRSDYSVDIVYYGPNLRVYKPIPCNNP